MDKNALHIKHWLALGAGFVEIGTITPKPQKANPSKILDRSLKHLSLWNNMGFPNKGLDFVQKKLMKRFDHSKSHSVSYRDSLLDKNQKLKSSGNLNENQKFKRKNLSPIFINIGKNRETPLDQALEDYRKSLTTLYPFASAFVINISSPNTKDLRKLFSAKRLPSFLTSLKQIMQNLNPKIPLILKLSPDEKDFIRIIEQSLSANIDGWCICNSTAERAIENLFTQRGGVSGKLLAPKSLSLLKTLTKYLRDNKVEDKLVISCGGVLTAQDVLERLREGAHLVQVYSALVFEGFGFFQSVSKEVSQKIDSAKN